MECKPKTEDKFERQARIAAVKEAREYVESVQAQIDRAWERGDLEWADDGALVRA